MIYTNIAYIDIDNNSIIVKINILFAKISLILYYIV